MIEGSGRVPEITALENGQAAMVHSEKRFFRLLEPSIPIDGLFAFLRPFEDFFIFDNRTEVVARGVRRRVPSCCRFHLGCRVGKSNTSIRVARQVGSSAARRVRHSTLLFHSGQRALILRERMLLILGFAAKALET